MASPKLRFGIHDFLNAQPIILPLKMDADRLNLELVLDAPAELAAKLKAGELDLAMIPSIEYLKNADGYRLVPGVCIASCGPVGSVLLVSKKPLDQVRTLAVDSRSRTSAALLSILFKRQLAPFALKGPADPNPDVMLQQNDAALIIGDQAFLVDQQHSDLTVLDLSEEWFKKTGKSMVHAVIAVRPEVRPAPELVQFLKSAAKFGMAHIEEIMALHRVTSCGLTADTCRHYLTEQIIFDLGKEELEGLMHFRDVCAKNNILDQQFPIEFV